MVGRADGVAFAATDDVGFGLIFGDSSDGVDVGGFVVFQPPDANEVLGLC